jgi:hypothetical protein
MWRIAAIGENWDEPDGSGVLPAFIGDASNGAMAGVATMTLQDGVLARAAPRRSAGFSFPAAEVARMRAHPGFVPACRQAIAASIALYDGNRLINLLLGDRGRSAISFCCLYLHALRDPNDARSGLTLTRLKAICADQNIASPGRIEAFAVLMRVLGFLEKSPGDNDRRVRQLVPTERMLAAYRNRWRAIIDALSTMHPQAVQLREDMENPDFVRAFLRSSGDRFLAGFRPLSNPTARALFGERNAGFAIAGSLLIAGGADDFPPRRPLSVSISALARQFGVSRVHVRKLLRDAESESFIARPAGDNAGIVVLPPLTEAIFDMFANLFLVMIASAQEAGAEIGDMGRAHSA